MIKSRKNNTITDNEEKWTYETTVSKVQHIIEQIESGELELAEVFDRFTLATEYLEQCEHFLASKQQHITAVIENLISN
ncbi:MAG TPA: exodeoxyribonuclease VII small subunit [Allocoleopsis sp.]